MEIKRGELYYADLSPVVGSEQGGVRPVLVVQNDVGNKYSPTVIAAAVTSRLTKARLPTHIEIAGQSSGLQKDSVILLEQIRTLDKRRLKERIDAQSGRRPAHQPRVRALTASPRRVRGKSPRGVAEKEPILPRRYFGKVCAALSAFGEGSRTGSLPFAVLSAFSTALRSTMSGIRPPSLCSVRAGSYITCTAKTGF